jgi:hypothetical protein
MRLPAGLIRAFRIRREIRLLISRDNDEDLDGAASKSPILNARVSARGAQKPAAVYFRGITLNYLAPNR